MPNCDFLAAGSDIDLVLNHVFDCGDFLVYENYSPFDHELVQFRTVSDVRSRYPSLGRTRDAWPSVLLMLFVPGTGAMISERINLDTSKCDGATFRYQATGWGLIQLQFGGLGPSGVTRSRTNHNSLKRALKWEAEYQEILGSASAWDWRGIENASRRLNNFIARAAVRKCGSHPVLPEAAQHMVASDA